MALSSGQSMAWLCGNYSADHAMPPLGGVIGAVGLSISMLAYMELNSKSEIGKNKKWKCQMGKSGCGTYMQPLGDVLQVQSDWGSAKLDSKSYSKETANEKWKWKREI